MTGGDRKKFFEIMCGLAENFSATVTDAGLEIRFKALKKYAIEEIEAAALEILYTRQYTTVPTVADFVHAIEGNPDDIAMIEAVNVLKAVKELGAGKSVKFNDPITGAVVHKSFGGWLKLCSELKEDEEQWFVKDFMKAYQTFRRNGITHTGHLAGAIEAENRIAGYLDNIPSPVPIGGKAPVKLIN